MNCRVCLNLIGDERYQAKEMMFGLREVFSYAKCSNCGTLQIANIPNDMSRYYPSNYYSFNLENPANSSLVKKIIRSLRNRYAIFGRGVLGGLLFKLFPDNLIRNLFRFKLNKNSKVLDIGCGSGSLLYCLKEAGIKNVLGADPYISKDIEYKNGLKILKKSIEQIEGSFDLIMFHHVFEHLANPLEVLKSVSKILNTNGACLIRIPVVDSKVWEEYKTDWVQLDAPRHFFLHTKKSMEILAKESGLILEEVFYDATEFSLWGSEQYKKDIPLMDIKSYLNNNNEDIFRVSQIQEFKDKIQQLNKEQNSDSAGFVLRKV